MLATDIGRDRTDIFEARGNAQTLEEKVVREFKAELEGIERKLQSQEDIFVNRFLAVCECFIAVRFEDHSDVLEPWGRSYQRGTAGVG